MLRFRRLAASEIDSMFRNAQQASSPQEPGTMRCPKCGQDFHRNEVTQTRSGKYVNGRYLIFCPRCGKDSPYNMFDYALTPDVAEQPRGRGAKMWDPGQASMQQIQMQDGRFQPGSPPTPIA